MRQLYRQSVRGSFYKDSTGPGLSIELRLPDLVVEFLANGLLKGQILGFHQGLLSVVAIIYNGIICNCDPHGLTFMRR